MKAVIQRVLKSSVEIQGKIYSEIGSGLLVFLGIVKGDTDKNLRELTDKIINLRIFEDENGKMNLNIKEIQGEIMIISQFTLCTDNNKSGNRPSFTNAENPEVAEKLYEDFIDYVSEKYEKLKIKSGKFAANMKVSLINDGPVTIIIER
ncbi:MAG TPA: D-aminoacyl-tRNA deacylase [Ignavibacteria bacterium]|nr:D-aminoacyl-tRNA deacylase [Ignavibacteria bacterium]